ncbi:MAG: glycosyltransferase family 4 protein [Acidobacteriota bacterium]
MPPLNIVHICDHLGWEGSRMHGVKRLFAWMMPRFDPRRFRASLVSLRRRDLSEDSLEQLGVDVTYLGLHKFDPRTFPALLGVLRRKQADLVHMHGYGATTFGRLCAWRLGIPSVLHEHANHTSTPWFQQVADRILAPHTDLAIAVSASTAEFTIRARLMPAERTKVVYLGSPLDEFARIRSRDERQAARASLGIDEDTIAVGTVTRLMPSKGNEYLVAATPEIVRRHARARVFIVGEGELQEPLEAQARALGLGDRLTFVGFRRDVADVLAAFDVLVFPSLWEGTPLTAFEALAAGKPIVATDADGLLDILTDRHDALVVPKRDAQALAAGVGELIDDEGLAARLSHAASRTGAKYDIGAFVRKMERLYEILHATSRATRRAGVLEEDLAFLTASE